MIRLASSTRTLIVGDVSVEMTVVTTTFLSLTGFLFTTLRLTSAAADPAWHTFHHEHVLGTSLELRFAASKAGDAQRAEAAALAEIDRLAAVLSGYDANSEFSRWAATRGEARGVSADLFNVLALFDSWRERTHGAVDAAAETAVGVAIIMAIYRHRNSIDATKVDLMKW